MTASIVPLDVYQGDDQTWTLQLWLDANGTPYDLAGHTAKAEIRAASGTPVLGELACTITLPNAIKLELSHTATAALPTGSAQWDLQLTNASGLVLTPIVGTVHVRADITDSAVVP